MLRLLPVLELLRTLHTLLSPVFHAEPPS